MGRLPKPTGGAGGDFSGMKGLDKPFKAGGKVSSASKRADGCAIRGKTRSMSLIDMGVKNLKAIGFGAAKPAERDRLFGMLTGSTNKSQDEKIKALEAEVAAGRKTKEQAQTEAGMKKGGKVSSASKRADGCAIRGKTKA
jgi:hypothetical protein